MSPLETKVSAASLAAALPGVEDAGALGPGGMPCLKVRREDLFRVMSSLKDEHGFSRLSLLTALDAPEGLQLVYSLTRSGDEAHVALKVPLAEDSLEVQSITPLWAGADWLEREVYDMFGVRFIGHPDLRRILLLEDFDGHPLRKSYGAQPPEGEAEGEEGAAGEGAAEPAAPVAPVVPAPPAAHAEVADEAGAERLAAFERQSLGPALRTEKIILNMGPQHPSTHGVLHFLLALEGEVVVAAEPSIGYLHRCTEKLCESRTYKQCIPMMDRADYVSGFFTEHALLLAAEELAGIEVPRKADYLRVLMSEMCRISSHLVWLGTFGLDLGALTPFLYCFKEREQILDYFEAITGGRMMFNYFRVGGVKEDLPAGIAAEMTSFFKTFDRAVDEYESLLRTNEIFLARTKGVGTITPEAIDDFCVTGPMARASGLARDIRVDEPYSAYGEFDVRVPTGRVGDCFDRYTIRVAEIREAARLALAALEGMPEGDYRNPEVPKVFKPEAGEAYRRVESPRGELGIYLVSDGTKQPYRMKIRSPALSNLHVAPSTLVGRRMGDVVAIIGSVDVVLGEIDR